MHVLLQAAHQLPLIAGLGVGMAFVHHDLLRRPVAGGAGQGLDVERHAVDHHWLALGALQHPLHGVALGPVPVSARALLQAAGQDRHHGVAGFAVAVNAFDLFLATDQSRYRAITGIGMLMTGVFHNLTDQGLYILIAAVGVLVGHLFLQTADQVPIVIAVIVVGVIILALHDAADQLAAGVAAGVCVLVGCEMAHVCAHFLRHGCALLLTADQHVRVAGLRVLVGLASADQHGRLSFAGFRQCHGQICRNQQHHRQHQRQHTPCAVGKSSLIHGASELILHVLILRL